MPGPGTLVVDPYEAFFYSPDFFGGTEATQPTTTYGRTQVALLSEAPTPLRRAFRAGNLGAKTAALAVVASYPAYGVTTAGVNHGFGITPTRWSSPSEHAALWAGPGRMWGVIATLGPMAYVNYKRDLAIRTAATETAEPPTSSPGLSK